MCIKRLVSITDFFAGCWGFRLRVVSGLVMGVGVNGPRNAFGSEPATLPVNLWGLRAKGLRGGQADGRAGEGRRGSEMLNVCGN